MKKQNNISYFQVVKTLLPAVFRAAPFWIAADCTVMVLSSTCFALNTVMMQMLFDSVTGAANGTVAFLTLIITVLAVAGVQIFNEILNGICNFLASPTSGKVSGVFIKKIHAKIAKLPAIDFENADILDYITKAQQGAGCALSLYHSVSTLLTFYIPYFIVMGIYLYALRPFLLWALVFIFVPLLIPQFVRGAVFTKLVDEVAPLRRKLDYYESEIFQRDFFKETRILGTFSFIKRLHAETLSLFCNKSWKAERKTQLVEIGLRVLTLIGYFGVLFLLFDSLMKNYITVGAFAAVFASVGTMFSFMDDAVTNYVGRMLRQSGTLKNYIRFMNLPEETGVDKELRFADGITAENISFKYPNSEVNAIENVSLHIKNGETIAFVGENGAGKTTLVKLLIGILKPDYGTVKIDNIPTTELSRKSLFAKTSGVFQKFQRYKMSLSDNIAIANTNEAIDTEKMNDVIAQSDIVLNESFTNSIDTILSREFDGIDLSGGQWQRVALARGLYKDSHLIVLDEPTSAIDPIEETKLYRKFKEISAGKTTIIVTHRLGSTKIADRIVVFNKGHIEEIGTHSELMAADSLYAEMYNSQAKWYADTAI